MKSGWSTEKLVDAISYMIVHKHFHEYVYEVHGDPETVAAQSPFSDASLERWWEGEFGPAYLESLRREAGTGVVAPPGALVVPARPAARGGGARGVPHPEGG